MNAFDIVEKSRTKRPHLKHKRIRFRNFGSSMPLSVLKERIEAMAEEEEALSRYEHGQEVG